MDVLFSIIVVLGICYGVYRGFIWMMRAGQAQTRKDPPLSPTDLKVLEESAGRLMADLRAVTDECVARIEKACADADGRIRPEGINIAIDEAKSVKYDSFDQTSPIANTANLTTGELELLKGLKAISSQN